MEVSASEALQPLTPADIAAVLVKLDGYIEDGSKQLKVTRTTLRDESFSSHLSKKELFDMLLSCMQEMVAVLSGLRKDLEAHRPPPEVQTGCNQCPAVFPVSSAAAHRDWHRRMSYPEDEV